MIRIHVLRLLALGLAAGPAVAADPIPLDPTGKPPPAATTPSPPPVKPGPYAPSATAPTPLPATAPLPIDLPTVIRLVNSNSPVIGIARARLAQAFAVQDRAEVLWLPDVVGGLNYNRFDGNTQNQRGEVFSLSRSNLFAGLGPSLRLDLGEAYFAPLVARRLTAAADAAVRATQLAVEFDAASAYLDLVRVYAATAINADTLARAEQMLKFAESATAAGLSKTTADVNRARTEVLLRQQERIDLKGAAGAASARLARLLLLQPGIDLRPADPAVLPLTLVPTTCTLDDLIATALSTRPDLLAERQAILVADARVRQARLAPLIPRAEVGYQVGGFGGGQNGYVGQFDARGVGVATVAWELDSLGFGNAAQVRERRAVAAQAGYRLADLQARAGAEVAESAKVAAARFETLDTAQQAVKEATELYRKLQETSFNMVGPRGQYDALEPLTAIQQLNTARTQYLTEVIEFNRAQFRLYIALGQPAEGALASPATALTVPVVPPPFVPEPRK